MSSANPAPKISPAGQEPGAPLGEEDHKLGSKSFSLSPAFLLQPSRFLSAAGSIPGQKHQLNLPSVLAHRDHRSHQVRVRSLGQIRHVSNF